MLPWYCPHRLAETGTLLWITIAERNPVALMFATMRDKNMLTAGDVMITVDFDRMRRLARDLRELAQRVGGHSGFVHSDALDHDLTGHLHRVENDCRVHRSHLQSFLSETATTIERIVAEYEKTNDTVASAATIR
ncbi:MAG: hypothetical protein ACJ74U_14425 [Jatrophihabitantaceae bacterium]